MNDKICSSGSVEGLQKLINSFYFSKNWEVKEDNGTFTAYNPVMGKTLGRIEFKKNKYTFYI